MSKRQRSHDRNVSTDPLGTGGGSGTANLN